MLFLDVRGFTPFAERAAAHEVVANLNELYEAVVPVILRLVGEGAGAQDRELESLARRATVLERLSERVTHWERGSAGPAPRSTAG